MSRALPCCSSLSLLCLSLCLCLSLVTLCTAAQPESSAVRRELPFLIGELGHWLRSEPGPNLTDASCRGSLDPKDATDMEAPGRTHHPIVSVSPARPR